MANAVYKRIFDDVFMMTSAEKRIRSSVFALYFGENTSDVSLWGLLAFSRSQKMVLAPKQPKPPSANTWTLDTWTGPCFVILGRHSSHWNIGIWCPLDEPLLQEGLGGRN